MAVTVVQGLAVRGATENANLALIPQILAALAAQGAEKTSRPAFTG